jgi:hypothetical protein
MAEFVLLVVLMQQDANNKNNKGIVAEIVNITHMLLYVIRNNYALHVIKYSAYCTFHIKFYILIVSICYAVYTFLYSGLFLKKSGKVIWALSFM